MSRTLIALAVLTAACLLAANSAMAGDCQQVRAHTGAIVYVDPPCSFQGVEYTGFCAEASVRGTLNGIWFAYLPEDYYAYIPEPLPGFSDLYANWHMSRFVTNRGEVWAHGADILNLEAYLTEATFSTTLWVVGGTGAYEGASICWVLEYVPRISTNRNEVSGIGSAG